MGGVRSVPDAVPKARLPPRAYYALTVLTALNVINVWHRYLIVSCCVHLPTLSVTNQFVRPSRVVCSITQQYIPVFATWEVGAYLRYH